MDELRTHYNREQHEENTAKHQVKAIWTTGNNIVSIAQDMKNGHQSDSGRLSASPVSLSPIDDGESSSSLPSPVSPLRVPHESNGLVKDQSLGPSSMSLTSTVDSEHENLEALDRDHIVIDGNKFYTLDEVGTEDDSNDSLEKVSSADEAENPPVAEVLEDVSSGSEGNAPGKIELLEAVDSPEEILEQDLEAVSSPEPLEASEIDNGLSKSSEVSLSDTLLVKDQDLELNFD